MMEPVPQRSTRLRLAFLSGVLAAYAMAAGTASVLAADGDERVLIADTLRPAQLQIDAGVTVTWRNQDQERHRVRSKDGPVEFDSGNLEQGESFSFTFSVEGSYAYYDQRDRDDAAYFGTIVVGGAALDPDAPLPETGSVSIIDRSFRPPAITVATGGSVDWQNADGEAHTVTAADGSFDSGIMNDSAAFTKTFDQPGSYPYFCAIHPEMRGTITVSDPVATAEDSGPAAGDVAPADPDEPSETSIDAGASPDPIGEPAFDSALGGLPSPLPAGTDGAQSGLSVSVIDLSFQPEAVEVAAGESVTWSNDDAVGHTVTADDGGFNSGVMTVGDSFSMTFDTLGTFDYFCAIHPEMRGTVTVLPPAADFEGGAIDTGMDDAD